MKNKKKLHFKIVLNKEKTRNRERDYLLIYYFEGFN